MTPISRLTNDPKARNSLILSQVSRTQLFGPEPKQPRLVRYPPRRFGQLAQVTKCRHSKKYIPEIGFKWAREPNTPPRTRAAMLSSHSPAVRQFVRPRRSARVRFCMLVLPDSRGACRKIACVERSSEGVFRIVGARFEKKSAKWARDSSWAICPIQLPTRFCKKRSLGLVM
jgi:hypothetical protein